MKISGEFDVQLKPMDTHGEGAGGVTLGHMSIDKTFAGALSATSRGEMLIAITGVKGSAGYVALEQVSGTLEGKSGSFVLQHFGTMDQGKDFLVLEVVPGSGAGELEGLSGKMAIRIEDEKHFYDFDYELARQMNRSWLPRWLTRGLPVVALVLAGAILWTPARSAPTASGEVNAAHPLAGRIFDPARQVFISRGALQERLAKVRHVLLGEIHDNAEHHRLQAEVIAGLARAGRKPVVVMEMITAKQAGALDAVLRHNTRAASTSPDLLGEVLHWEKSGWPPFKIYQPVFAAALDHKLTISAGEPVPEAPGKVLALTDGAPLDAARNVSLLAELKVSHCGAMPDAVLPKVAVAQRKRDAGLALAMTHAGAANGDGTVLVAGGGHARTDRGVPHYLRHLGAPSISVIFAEVTEGQVEPVENFEAGTADLVWFTSRHKREDPCIALLRKFGKTTE